MSSVSTARRAGFFATTAISALSAMLASAPAEAIIINNNFPPGTPGAIVQPGVTGVGMMNILNENGSLGVCTGTLINPRMVLFAAHCVNTRPATAYGANSGGRPIAFGFESDVRGREGDGSGDELFNWAAPGPNQFRSSITNAFYNARQVFWNPQSVSPTSCVTPTQCFLEADIAIAALDTPTRNVPFWTLLFSPLTTPTAINPATGTGYHASIVGYGGNGTEAVPTPPPNNIDFRRRAAENMLGALTSFDRMDAFIFGAPPSGNPQVLYQLDFDDPARGTPASDPFDFNVFRDNALTREGTTAGGDSGGPLIIDQAFARPIVIGVLSGGSRFFGPQPFSTYGTTSFYQPLFLYWDWIVANNPYRYVTANAGNFNWEDGAAWVTELDPAYQILVNGAPTGGLPTNTGAGPTGSTPNFGEICIQQPLSSPNPVVNECENLATGQPRNGVPNTPSGQGGEAPAGAPATSPAMEVAGGPATVDISVELAAAGASAAAPTASVETAAQDSTAQVAAAQVATAEVAPTASARGAQTASAETTQAVGRPTGRDTVAISGISGGLSARDTAAISGVAAGLSGRDTVAINGTARPGEVETIAIGGAVTVDGVDTTAIGGSANVDGVETTAIGGAVDIQGIEHQPQNHLPGFTDTPRPAASLANGLPGATNFVPNNFDGVRTTGVPARYFDVMLRNTGTITLSSTVTVDRFGIMGANSALNIATAGSLTSIIDITQSNGRVNVDGTFRSEGDYALIGGLLSGRGTVVTPFLTSVLGTIAPGTLGTIGTLTVSGNIVMSSGTQTAIDLGTNGVSDLLRTTANGTSTGVISLAGALVLTPVVRPIFNNTYTVVNAAGGRLGTFASANALSAILRPEVTYTANTVNVRIIAVPYSTVINANSPVQTAFATLLDANRAAGNYNLLADAFGELDALATAAEVQAVLESAAPRTEATIDSIMRMTTDTMGRFYRDRSAFMSSGDAGGTLTMIGTPVQLASAALTGTGLDGLQTMSDAGSAMVTSHGALPDHVSAYLAGGYLNGESDPLPGLVGGRDDLEGWYVGGGIEVDVAEGTRIGVGLHYARADGQSTPAQAVDASLIQGTFYMASELGNGFVGTGQLSIGLYTAESERVVVAGTTTFTLEGQNDGLAASGEIGFGYRLPLGSLTLTPNIAGRYTIVDFGESIESGGGLALRIADREYESLQGRFGADLGGTIEGGSVRVSPRLTATFVHEFLDQDDDIIAGFAATGFAGGFAPFVLPNRDREWFEVGGGLRIGGERVSFDVSADTTIGRGDLSYQTYRAGVTVRF